VDPLWITYAWKDDEGGDFSYLAQELEDVGVPVKYDKVALVPGRPLWEQIANEIASKPLSGWASLLTPNSLNRLGCREELSYALGRALGEKGEDFPLIGLLHGVSIDDVPTPLRVRLCVDLNDRNWREQVRAGVEGRPPTRAAEQQAPYIISVHPNYLGSGKAAIEARPRFGTMMYWRLAVPKSATVVSHGVGPAGGGGMTGKLTTSIEGETELNGVACTLYGSGDTLSSAVSAYAQIDGALPDFIAFGVSRQPFGGIEEGIVVPLR